MAGYLVTGALRVAVVTTQIGGSQRQWCDGTRSHLAAVDPDTGSGWLPGLNNMRNTEADVLYLACRLRLLGALRKAALRVDGCCQGIRQAVWRRDNESRGHIRTVTLSLSCHVEGAEYALAALAPCQPMCMNVRCASEDGRHAQLRCAPALAALWPWRRPSSRPAAGCGQGHKGSRACMPATRVIVRTPNMEDTRPACLRVTHAPPRTLQPVPAATPA